MGTLLLTDGHDARVVPLSSSTLVGRAWSCVARVEHAACPLYWLEVRWMGGGWAWRALAAGARTRGTGARLRDEWRALTSAFGRGARVTLDEACAIELVDDGPPRPFAVDALSGAPLTDEELEALAEVRPDGVWPLEGSGTSAEALGDGQTFVAPDGNGGTRVLRVHVPGVVSHTAETRVDLQRDGARVIVDVAELRATILQGRAAVEVRGECVRVLAVYAEARGADLPSGGWLKPAEAHTAWVAQGGRADSPLRRIEWERARLRGRLAREGVASVDRLFEVRREGDTMRTRLAVDAEIA
jgi:hypothetical protein